MLPLPFLPSNGTVELTDSHDPFMKEAELACKELSNELMQPTGAVIVKDGVVVARGLTTPFCQFFYATHINRVSVAERRLKLNLGLNIGFVRGVQPLLVMLSRER
jgi:hypothetical protein